MKTNTLIIKTVLFSFIVFWSVQNLTYFTFKTDSTKNLSPISRLLEGNERFVKGNQIHLHQDIKRVYETSKEQHPFVVVITCSDSRVDPDIIFDQGIGDLFVIRNAGNILSDIDLGSIEYAVEHLNVSLVVVMGHTDCGAIKAFVKRGFTKEHASNSHHIDVILDSLAQEKEIRALDKNDPKFLNMCIDANIDHAANVLNKNAIIQEKGATVVKMLYETNSGKISVIE